jgi:beta-glucanase (GH16 family)
MKVIVLFLQLLSIISQITKSSTEPCISKNFTFTGVPYNSLGISADYNAPNVVQTQGNLELRLTEQTGGTRITVGKAFQYGTIEVKMRVSPGSNIVTSFILMADNGDEIDFEYVGKDPKQIQTNYFYKGVPIFDKNAKFFATGKDLTTTYNTYKLHWTKDYYEWIYNGFSLRKMYRNDTQNFPDSPSKLQFGIWKAQNSKWAGFGVDWAEAPFAASIEYIKITCNNTSHMSSQPVKSLPTNTTSIIKPTNTTSNIKPTNERSVTLPTNSTSIVSPVEPTPGVSLESSNVSKLVISSGIYCLYALTLL